jgi:plastocyanin
MRYPAMLFAALLQAIPAMAAEQADIAAVTVEQFAFSPASLTVRRGTQVAWLNKDETPHNIVAGDHSFTSPALDTGEEFRFTFDKPGRYGYFCRLHPHMTGEIIVTP